MKALFESPSILVLTVACIPAVYYVFLRFGRIREQLQNAGQRGWQGSSISTALYIRTVFFSLSWILLVIAAAGPRWGTRLEPVREQGTAVMFVLDVSRSMTAEDIPSSRLSFASQYLARLAGELAPVPCGLVVFKGEAFLSIPLTVDRSSLFDVLRTAGPAMITAPGSAPAFAVQTAASAFPPALAASRYIILLTDGEQTAGSLTAVAGELRGQGVTLVTVGIGTAEGTDIDAFASPDNSRIHRTRLDADLLKEAARAAGGSSRYLEAVRPGSAMEILEELTAATKQGKKNTFTSKTVKRYPGFLLGAILAFCAALSAGGLTWKKS